MTPFYRCLVCKVRIPVILGQLATLCHGAAQMDWDA